MSTEPTNTAPIGTVLIANRGEIALRLVRGVSDRGLRSVAVYADQDRDAGYTAAADDAYALGGTTPAETYLNAAKILEIAQRSGADALHPGYGFLAENPEFAAAVRDAGIVWIGPSAESILALGDKVQARAVAQRVGVAPVPGTDQPLGGRQEVEDFIATHGYPIVIKQADGGGGRGITVITNETDLDNFFSGRDEATLGTFFVERFVEKARHIETQCGRDSHGNFTVYSTRDCSLQRRHQKMVEEAPAPFLTPEVEATLRDSSRRLFEGVDYVGLGTCEFLLEPNGSVYFLEVNPRLQVEHTVTEEVTGIDLVGEQLAIAAGESLTQAAQPRGHSFEFRITSEDPAAGLTPSLGTLTELCWPLGPGVRIDTGVTVGTEVTPDFDSMIAKLIVTGNSRNHALARSRRALDELRVSGVGTPVSLYRAIVDLDEFSGDQLGIWTRWLEEQFLPGFLAGAAASADATGSAGASPLPEKPHMTHFAIEVNGQRHELALPSSMLMPQQSAETPRKPQPLRSQREGRAQSKAASQDPNLVTADLQAIVVRIACEPGQTVAEGDLVLVLESMKMEKYVHAPRAGVVKEILTQPGENVAPGTPLIRLTPAAGDANDAAESEATDAAGSAAATNAH